VRYTTHDARLKEEIRAPPWGGWGVKTKGETRNKQQATSNENFKENNIEYKN